MGTDGAVKGFGEASTGARLVFVWRAGLSKRRPVADLHALEGKEAPEKEIAVFEDDGAAAPHVPSSAVVGERPPSHGCAGIPIERDLLVSAVALEIPASGKRGQVAGSRLALTEDDMAGEPLCPLCYESIESTSLARCGSIALHRTCADQVSLPSAEAPPRGARENVVPRAA
jgi:hypothetical protein